MLVAMDFCICCVCCLVDHGSGSQKGGASSLQETSSIYGFFDLSSSRGGGEGGGGRPSTICATSRSHLLDRTNDTPFLQDICF